MEYTEKPELRVVFRINKNKGDTIKSGTGIEHFKTKGEKC